MLCIRGRQLPVVHTGLVAGEVYDVSMTPWCCETRALAAGSVFKRNCRMTCNKCGARMRILAGDQVPWGPDRFIKWDNPKVDKKEVRRLFQPGPRRKLPGEIKDPALTPVIDDWLERG